MVIIKEFEKYFPLSPKYKIFMQNVAPKNDHYHKFVCSSITQRGLQGETLLHLCLMNGSFIHMLIAKRLLHHFPSMVHDIFIGYEEYGNFFSNQLYNF